MAKPPPSTAESKIKKISNTTAIESVHVNPWQSPFLTLGEWTRLFAPPWESCYTNCNYYHEMIYFSSVFQEQTSSWLLHIKTHQKTREPNTIHTSQRSQSEKVLFEKEPQVLYVHLVKVSNSANCQFHLSARAIHEVDIGKLKKKSYEMKRWRWGWWSFTQSATVF